jgi:hypothetical protein
MARAGIIDPRPDPGGCARAFETREHRPLSELRPLTSSRSSRRPKVKVMRVYARMTKSSNRQMPTITSSASETTRKGIDFRAEDILKGCPWPLPPVAGHCSDGDMQRSSRQGGKPLRANDSDWNEVPYHAWLF